MKRVHRWILIFFVLKCVTGCYPGILSLGGTSPSGDLTIATDDTLIINCTLNANLNDSRNASDIIWKVGDSDISPENVAVLDYRTAQLKITKVKRSDTGRYACYLKNNEKHNLTSLCVNDVEVGDLIQNITNFKCISMEWENLTCTWKPQHTGLRTTWTLKFDNRVGFSECPQYLEDATGEVNGCFYSSTAYPAHKTNISFHLSAKNALGGTKDNFFIKNKQIIIAPPPLNLHVVERDVNMLKVQWQNNPKLETYRSSVIYRVMYRSEWDPIDTWKVANLSGNTSYILSNLIPWTDFTVMIRSKILRAMDTDEMWSQGVNTTQKTLATIPSEAVEISSSGFDDVNVDMDKRNVTIFWKPLLESEHNGPNFRYIIKVFLDGQKVHEKVTKSSQNFSATFSDLQHRKSYTFTVQAVNAIGAAANLTKINVPKTDNILSDIQSFTVIYYDDGLYEAQWKPTNDSAVENYVIFYCKSSQIRSDLCQEAPEWIVVDSKTNEYNITVPDKNSNYRFAVSASGLGFSSGMNWSKCIPASFNGLVRKIRILGFKSESPTQIRVSWHLDCTDLVGIIQGFRIMYCIKGVNQEGCQDTQRIESIFNYQVTSYVLNDLKPFTNYSVRVAAITKNGEFGELGEEHVAETLESNPNCPTNLTESAVTNSSITVSWLAPTTPNGVITKYVLQYNNHYKPIVPVSFSRNFSTVLQKGIEGYSNYSIRVKACNKINCSDFTDALVVTTLTGVPGEMQIPTAKLINETHAVVTWKNPKNPNGPIDSWDLLVQQNKDGDDNNETQTHRLLDHQLTIKINCGTRYLFAIRGINEVPGEQCKQLYQNNPASTCEPLKGHYSSNAVYEFCFKDNLSTLEITMVAVGAFICLTIIIITLIKLSGKFKKMKPVKIILPPGLIHNQLNTSKMINNDKPNYQRESIVPLYGRLQSISSDEGRSSQSSAETTISLSSVPEDVLSSDIECKHSLDLSPNSVDSGNESDLTSHSPDSVFEDSASVMDLFKQIQTMNQQTELEEDVIVQKCNPTSCYSKIAMLNEPINTGVVVEPVVISSRPPVPPAYSRLGVPNSTVNYVCVNDVGYTSKIMQRNEVQAGYSKVATKPDSSGPITNRPINGYVMADSMQKNDDKDINRNLKVNQTIQGQEYIV